MNLWCIYIWQISGVFDTLSHSAQIEGPKLFMKSRKSLFTVRPIIYPIYPYIFIWSCPAIFFQPKKSDRVAHTSCLSRFSSIKKYCQYFLVYISSPSNVNRTIALPSRVDINRLSYFALIGLLALQDASRLSKWYVVVGIQYQRFSGPCWKGLRQGGEVGVALKLALVNLSHPLEVECRRSVHVVHCPNHQHVHEVVGVEKQIQASGWCPNGNIA